MAFNHSICTHSSPQEYIIFSVYASQATHTSNIKRHVEICRKLYTKDIPYKELMGYYKGTPEQSIICNAEHLPYILGVAQLYCQETILLLKNHKHGLRRAYLLYVDTTAAPSDVTEYQEVNSLEYPIEFIGYLRSVPKEVALGQQSWSKDIGEDNYWIVTPDDETRVKYNQWKL